jgi:hypothetical protein
MRQSSRKKTLKSRAAYPYSLLVTPRKTPVRRKGKTPFGLRVQSVGVLAIRRLNDNSELEARKRFEEYGKRKNY